MSISFHKQVFQIVLYLLQQHFFIAIDMHLEKPYQLTVPFTSWCAKPSYFAKVFTETTQNKNTPLFLSRDKYNHMSIIFHNLEASTKNFGFYNESQRNDKICMLAYSKPGST